MEKTSTTDNQTDVTANRSPKNLKLEESDRHDVRNQILQPKSASSEELRDKNGGDNYDDLDDLDDMLDEFDTIKSEPNALTSKAYTDTNLDDEFERQLKAGMAEIFGDSNKPNEINTKFENIFKQLGDIIGQEYGSGAQSTPSTSKENRATTTSKSTATRAEEKFQKTIKETMERMTASGDQATAAAAALESDGDIFSEMLKAVETLSMDGEPNDEDLSKAILGMMEQLTHKEVLYEPMRELDERFPRWIEEHADKLDKADLKRYQEQQIYVCEIVKRFESPNYNDDSAADKEYIVERMQKMQAAGPPPTDLVGGMEAAQAAFGAPEKGCPIQ